MKLARFHDCRSRRDRAMEQDQMVPALSLPKPGGMCYHQKLTWSIRAKKWAVTEMGLEDNHNWNHGSAFVQAFLGQIRPCIFIVI